VTQTDFVAIIHVQVEAEEARRALGEISAIQGVEAAEVEMVLRRPEEVQ
jgi:2-keto-3-deoxy-L-rhamnonate aldolase RhmA